MTGGDQFENGIPAAVADSGLDGLRVQGVLGLGEDEVEPGYQPDIGGDLVCSGGDLETEVAQDALNLILLFADELPELVAELKGGPGLDEEGGAGIGHIVDDASNVLAVFHL